MFKLILIIITIVIIIIIITNNRKIKISKTKIKHIINDKGLFNKHSKEAIINSGIQSEILFYTNKDWDAYSNNYIHDSNNNTYYIIEKGYYYYLTPNNTVHLEPDVPLKVMQIDLSKKDLIKFNN